MLNAQRSLALALLSLLLAPLGALAQPSPWLADKAGELELAAGRVVELDRARAMAAALPLVGPTGERMLDAQREQARAAAYRLANALRLELVAWQAASDKRWLASFKLDDPLELPLIKQAFAGQLSVAWGLEIELERSERISDAQLASARREAALEPPTHVVPSTPGERDLEIARRQLRGFADRARALAAASRHASEELTRAGRRGRTLDESLAAVALAGLRPGALALGAAPLSLAERVLVGRLVELLPAIWSEGDRGAFVHRTARLRLIQLLMRQRRLAEGGVAHLERVAELANLRSVAARRQLSAARRYVEALFTNYWRDLVTSADEATLRNVREQVRDAQLALIGKEPKPIPGLLERVDDPARVAAWAERLGARLAAIDALLERVEPPLADELKAQLAGLETQLTKARAGRSAAVAQAPPEQAGAGAVALALGKQGSEVLAQAPFGPALLEALGPPGGPGWRRQLAPHAGALLDRAWLALDRQENDQATRELAIATLRAEVEAAEAAVKRDRERFAELARLLAALPGRKQAALLARQQPAERTSTAALYELETALLGEAQLELESARLQREHDLGPLQQQVVEQRRKLATLQLEMALVERERWRGQQLRERVRLAMLQVELREGVFQAMRAERSTPGWDYQPALWAWAELQRARHAAELAEVRLAQAEREASLEAITAQGERLALEADRIGRLLSGLQGGAVGRSTARYLDATLTRLESQSLELTRRQQRIGVDRDRLLIAASEAQRLIDLTAAASADPDELAAKAGLPIDLRLAHDTIRVGALIEALLAVYDRPQGDQPPDGVLTTAELLSPAAPTSLHDIDRARLLALAHRAGGVLVPSEHEASLLALRLLAAVRGIDSRASSTLLVLQRELQTLIDKLEAIQAESARQKTAVAELHARIINRVYWLQDDRPLTPDLLASLPAELLRVVRLLQEEALAPKRPLALAVALLLILLGVLLSWLFRHDPPAPPHAGRAGWLRIVSQLMALLTVTASAPISFAAAGWMLQTAGGSPALTQPVTAVLFWLAALLFARRFLVRVLRSQDALRHVQIGAPVAEQLRRSVGRLTAVGLIAGVPWSAAYAIGEWARLQGTFAQQIQVLPRLLYTALLAGGALVVLRLLRPSGALMQALTGGSGFWGRLWRLAYVPIALAGVAIVAMDVAGYRTGSWIFTRQALQLLGIAAVLAIADAICSNLANRAIYAMLRATSRQLTEADKEASARTRMLDLRERYQRFREVVPAVSRMVGTLVVVVGFLLLVWGFALLEGVRTSLVGTHLASWSDGTVLSVWDVVCALAWVAAGQYLLYSLPLVYELVEFVTPDETDVATRYVAMTLARYLILIVSYGAALVTMHFSLASVGWLVAAMSVGIGFGLQEIIANFISGLILLVEQPVRVGDIVTVGSESGKVRKINIRATEVDSFDGRTLVIPNKQLITTSVLNWTYNNTLIRREVLIGVGYDSDPELVQGLLLQAAIEQEAVLRDPAPSVHFVGFGESSLDFRLRYHTDLSDGMATDHAVRGVLLKRLTEAGIDIPFPHREVKVTLPAPAGSEPAPARPAAPAGGQPAVDEAMLRQVFERATRATPEEPPRREGGSRRRRRS